MFVKPTFDTIIDHVILFNYKVSGLRSAEESVPAIVEDTTTDNNMLALLYLNASGVVHVISQAGSARRLPVNHQHQVIPRVHRLYSYGSDLGRQDTPWQIHP